MLFVLGILRIYSTKDGEPEAVIRVYKNRYLNRQLFVVYYFTARFCRATSFEGINEENPKSRSRRRPLRRRLLALSLLVVVVLHRFFLKLIEGVSD